MDQTQTQRYVPRFEPLTLRPRLHREGFLIHYTPTEGTSTEEDMYNPEYRTPLSNTNLHRGLTTTIHLYRRGIRPVANNQTPPHNRGSKHNLNLYQRGSNPIKARVYNKWLQRPQTLFLFPQTK